ncbi:MAG: shikimate kinase [Candidatus Eisenbacteria bacterium]|nr:shikimate kinase [Candidatus Eisenbacteria bacterium]
MTRDPRTRSRAHVTGRRATPGGRGVFRRHAALLGMMGSGKSTLAPLVAARLRMGLVDTDSWIEARAGRSVARIFARDGEPAFRALELEALDFLRGRAPAVIAAGGGLVSVPAAARRLRALACCMFLDASPVVLAGRLDAAGHRSRPLLRGAERDPAAHLSRMLAGRLPAYEAAAHAVLRVDGLSARQAASLAAWALAALGSPHRGRAARRRR